MNNEKFEIRVNNWRKSFEKIGQDMAGTTNEDGKYPQIDFSPLVLAFEQTVSKLRQSRKSDPLILVPSQKPIAKAVAEESKIYVP